MTKYFLIAVTYTMFGGTLYDLQGTFNSKQDCEYVLNQVSSHYIGGRADHICSTDDLSKPQKDN